MAQVPGTATTEEALLTALARPEATGAKWRRRADERGVEQLERAPPIRRAQCDDLVAIAAAEMDRLYEQIRGSGYALLLTDTCGTVLHEKVDSGMRGFCSPGRGLAGAGAPIRGPDNDVIAVLDAFVLGSHDTRPNHLHTVALLRLSAQLIERCVFLRHHRQRQLLRFHTRAELVDLLHDGVLALADEGTVIAADAAAVQLLAASDRYELLGRSIDDIFDFEGQEVFSAAPQYATALWPVRDRGRAQRYYLSVHGGSRAPRNEPAARSYRPAQVVQVVADPRVLGLTLEELAGEDPQMLRNIRSARRIADSGVSVLIQGPTGSGKEAFAHAMHRASHRAKQAFVAVNCAAIPETLIESELFGYRAGAFTGARKDGMRGKILQSSGGTLFLDEIGDMPLPLQTRLLRVLEEREIVPLGAETPIKVELHVVAASHHNLRQMIACGSFREDLYYRLNGITLELPALANRADRERVIHRVLAAETSDGRPAAIEMDALMRLVSYPWPGNIRELRNVIRTALAICDGGVVRRIDLPREIREAVPSDGPAGGAAPSLAGDGAPRAASNPLQAAERIALLRIIDDCHGNMTRAAERLGMSRTTLYRKLKRHEVQLGAGELRNSTADC